MLSGGECTSTLMTSGRLQVYERVWVACTKFQQLGLDCYHYEAYSTLVKQTYAIVILLFHLGLWVLAEVKVFGTQCEQFKVVFLGSCLLH